jgi:SAM-dependent methyltransferase
MECRHCSAELRHTFVDLGRLPPSNSFLEDESQIQQEKYYPLRVMVCDQCWLVQTEDFVGVNEIFSEDYVYFSSYSSTWLAHSRTYVDNVTERFGLGSGSMVAEVAANDGYLLQYVIDKEIPCYGIEPAHSTATAARKKGIDIVEDFFGKSLAIDLVEKGRQVDLCIANNVLAHVPDINDFVKGFALLLKPQGIAVFEFPHLLSLVNNRAFDTIYHEHFSYLSLFVVCSIFTANGLTIFDVEELQTHGGSLRVYAQRADSANKPVNYSVKKFMDIEKQAGLQTLAFYAGFQSCADKIKNDLLGFLANSRDDGKKVIAYGAAAKGNTLLNYAGVKQDLIQCVIDRNPSKIHKLLPGSHIPVFGEDKLKQEKPDYVLILAWNLKDEITQQLGYIREWGGKFVVAIPKLAII